MVGWLWWAGYGGLGVFDGEVSRRELIPQLGLRQHVATGVASDLPLLILRQQRAAEVGDD